MKDCTKCGQEITKELEVKERYRGKTPEDDPSIYTRNVCRICFNHAMKLYKRKYDRQKKDRANEPSAVQLSQQYLRIAL